MDDIQSATPHVDSTPAKIQKLQQAFSELEIHRGITLNLKWKELEEHFHWFERSLKERFDELEDQKRAYERKASEARDMLEKKEAMVLAKEKASLERLQERRDAAFSALGAAVENCKDPSSLPTADGSSEMNLAALFDEETHSEVGKVNPVSSPLMKLCQEMNAEGLLGYISENRKNLATIREEIPAALRSSSSPFTLVLGSLKGFYRLDMRAPEGKKDANLLGIRRTCLMLMESLSQLLGESNPTPENLTITSDIKEQARTIAGEWRPRLNELDVDARSGNSLEVHAFLQLLATFRIAREFDQDDICNLITSVSRRRQIAELCHSLELTHRMPGVIGTLLSGGRHIEAINLAFAFDLTEQFPPVPLLKAFLKEARASPAKSGNPSSGPHNEPDERELSALKAAIKCIEEHKLQGQLPVDPLQRRLLQFGKDKADVKRAAEAARPLPKRPRANATHHPPHAVNALEKSFFYRGAERYPYAHERQHFQLQEAHGSPLLGAAAYGLSPSRSSYHSGYYGNGCHPFNAQYIH
ncbi:unnamed protein product [Spirodela intermedia]|uniref:FRIGIDA-like protein n=1 Tax=Spirodela intermedia TaxID=51605 RepID=A0A7I8JC45_SPIIN|nr:unnamed protein product [Spirodela intermedia]CAA6667757.1 unnamed protein product [Spirodela intermedia]